VNGLRGIRGCCNVVTVTTSEARRERFSPQPIRWRWVDGGVIQVVFRRLAASGKVRPAVPFFIRSLERKSV